jgi:hypothetical protein
MDYVSLEKIIIKGTISPLIISKTLRPHGFNKGTGKNWWFYPVYYLIFPKSSEAWLHTAYNWVF